MAKRPTLTVIGWLAMVVGVGAIVLTLGTLVQHTILAAPVTSGSWTGGTLYLSSAAGRNATPSCEIAPERGEPRTVSLPQQKLSRGVDLNGRAVSRWFTGSAAVRCGGPVRLSVQPWPVGFWLADRSWLMLPAALVAVGGWIVRPSLRSRRR